MFVKEADLVERNPCVKEGQISGNQWMTSNHVLTIDVGIQAGDKRAGEVFAPLHRILNQLLTKHCAKSYGEALKSVRFVLRVDGDIQHWDKDGCDKMRVRKVGEAGIDIFISRPLWQASSPSQLRQFLAAEMRRGFAMMIAKLNKVAIIADYDHLAGDFERAMLEFEAAS